MRAVLDVRFLVSTAQMLQVALDALEAQRSIVTARVRATDDAAYEPKTSTKPKVSSRPVSSFTLIVLSTTSTRVLLFIIIIALIPEFTAVVQAAELVRHVLLQSVLCTKI